eukprot:CAMPEP_0197066092 /NCGR_PEP_ID=MMETSP1384-20130603/171312_1 /TAXON_ID=29189 /ORGANISM="Ammonia sp." /LENGTH=42 /DNA_ID= /DNA_START= /DNA_END= /DNA_ORIENTATION=
MADILANIDAVWIQIQHLFNGINHALSHHGLGSDSIVRNHAI